MEFRMPPKLISLLLLFHLVNVCVADSFHQKIHGVKIAHDSQANDQRLKHLADYIALASSSSFSSTIRPSSIPSSSNLASSISPSASQSGSLGSTLSSTSSASLAEGTLVPAATAATSFQIYFSDDLPTSSAPPSACASALTASVSCNDTIQLMGANPWFDADSLALMCTTTCTNSLKSYRSNVVNSCGSYQLPGSNDISYAPTLAVDTILGPYSVECEKDTTSGAYCNVVLQKFGPVPAQGILGYPTNELCTSCMLGTLNATLSNPLTYDPSVYANLQSALHTCGSSFNQYNVTNPPTTTSIYIPGPSSTPIGSNVTTSASCAVTGRNITTTSNTTCAAIGSQYSVTWYDVLANNPTIPTVNCTTGIGPGTPLCLPKPCTTYTPVANQTCADVVDAANSLSGSTGQNITTAQLISFNPNLGAGCTQMGRQYGLPLCISPHGGFPDVGSENPGNPMPSGTPTAIVPPPGPTVSGTTSNCGGWYFVQPNDYCTKVVLNNSITLDDFLTLNPEVNANCTNLWADYYYCVAAYPPLASVSATVTVAPTGIFTLGSMTLGSATSPTPFPYPTSGAIPPSNVADGTITNGCNWYYTVRTGDTCPSVEKKWNVTDSDFTDWNSNPDTPCPSLVAGSAVCVLVLNATLALPPTPTNAAAGSAPSGCAKWYTIVSGDNCGTVETKFNISQGDFFALNPELNTQCTNLGLGEAYCVKSPPTTTTPPPSGPTPPANLNPGSWSNCTTYYTVQSGDTCNAIEGKYNIAFSDFLLWNPEVSSSCSNLNLAAYCVGTSGGCSKIYTVASGDFCSKIESSQGISDAQLHSLNPWLDSNCDLQVGQNLCITGGTPTSPPSSTPTNINPGSWTNCTTYYDVQSGDTCTAIDQKYTISLTDFLRWNPEVSNTCSNLNLASYCVKGSSACSKIYTVASGDFCSKIESAQGITDAQLHSLNPWIDSNCDLQVGQNLCV